MQFLNRNLLLLFGAQMVFVSGSVLLVTVGGIAGHQLAPNPSLATLPVALMVIGTASATVPAALIMQRLGRRWGFVLATVIAASGSGLATLALQQSQFWFFCLATALVGASLGFSQQFRFAAAESVGIDHVSHAVSFILLGSIAGAFLGPELVAQSAAADSNQPYVQAFVWLIGLYLAAGVLLANLKIAAPQASDPSVAAQPVQLSALLSRPMFLTAVMAGVVGQGVMTYVMTATPISMNIDHHFSLETTSEVIRAHVIAMYLPSLFTPWLIAWLGLPRMMLLGLVALSATILIGLGGHHLMHYWWAMVLLGVGWNFLFVAGTSMLVGAYEPHERFKAQALNDFSVFGASALASLGAGAVLIQLGWLTLLLSTVPALLIMVFMLWILRRSSKTAPEVI